MDTRVFRNIVKMLSLYSSSEFMSARCDKDAEEKINNLHRLMKVCKSQRFRTVPYTIVTKQYTPSINAVEEENKFLKYIDFVDWPDNINTLRNNLLLSTMLDE